MSTTRIAIAGATGYAGEELIRLLLNHPHARIACLAASAKWDRSVPASEVFPRLARHPALLDRLIEAADPDRLAQASDVVFLALPHGASMTLAPALLAAGKRIIDLSGDFRLRDPALYPQWYQLKHPHPELLTDSRVAYGLTEFHREEIRTARLVANPGCYATSILLGCLPLFRAGLVDDGHFFVDAKSGLTGAGRKAEASLLFAEMAGNLRAYKVNTHQHMPEVLQEIARVTGHEGRMTFVPQVIPVARGLISMLYVKTRAARDAVQEAYQRDYPADRAPFVRLRSSGFPQLTDVVETNYCDIGYVLDPSSGSLIVASALDNLAKGAAGQAVQNLNVMMGWPETLGLL